MRLTTRGRYAVTAMLDLAQHANRGPVTLAEISNRQQISLSYLEQLFAKLRRGGLVGSVRGPGGGYQLDRGAEQISVAAIIRAVDEPIHATSCKDKGTEGCRRDTRCITHDLWARLGEHIYHYLESVSLAQLMRDGSALAMLGEAEVDHTEMVLRGPH
ncbi:transcriptional regulator, BadM/Rrf2 family [Magnetococcus marinus MC-1]|uniref:Transcriptional regulator, BadM/Rrf2 family n=1 Tax=Magnetococcus marinus (strain ATCC BAA-1437 / JCM 17883 / MC-1) TaxID=156889 RepID=A0LC62_MAGMM|nr:Fe-S cluster assembly transcriptional regulator IscR [Magnetococcus marinus]ABK45555.1 transcriptional regulator, BadM/Rrf2 family [Magnetococcus marinus MC-1]